MFELVNLGLLRVGSFYIVLLRGDLADEEERKIMI